MKTIRRAPTSWLIACALLMAGCGSGASLGTGDASPGNPGDAGGAVSSDAAAADGPATAIFAPVRIVCGQPSAVTDADGNVWNADEDYTGGITQLSTGQTVAGTTSPALYAGQRYGESNGNGAPFQYTIAVPPGQYSVLLKFDEGYFAPGGRIFNVAINGTSVLANFDIAATAHGATLTAVDENFQVDVGSGGSITIAFSPVVQDPKIDAIAIVQGSAGDAGSEEGGDAGASPAEKVLSYLSGLTKGTSKRVLSGQHAQIWHGDSVSAAMSDVTPLTAQTGQAPAILGVVMNYVGNSGAYSIDVANTMANQWWARGGLVELSIYSDDPTFSYNSTGYPIGSSIPAAAFHELTDTTSASYKQWHSQLDTYAAELHTLTDSGNVVLLRPFIELNGDWNWYGAQSPADFVVVWRDMYDYLMKTKGLANVLWIYNVNSFAGNYSEDYPGAAYVDIVGMDIYDVPATYVADANSGDMYAFLVSTGKPLILPEVGLAKVGKGAPPVGANSIDNSQLIDIIRNSLPNVVGFVDWCDVFALDNQNGASTLLNDSWVVDLSSLPSGI